MRMMVNGEPSTGTIPATDSSVLRGDGCFEVLKSYGGQPFTLDDHLDRLERSAASLEIQLPGRGLLSKWIREAAADCPDCAIRVVVTRGSALPGESGEPLVIVFAHPWDAPRGPLTLGPVAAPWHAAGVAWDLAGAKMLSYAPNLSASRRAVKDGFDDALLMTTDGSILEGPTFSVAWMAGDVLETPALDLGILDSITRRVVIELAADLDIEVREGVWSLDHLDQASEMMALSTIREVQPVSVVGTRRFAEGPVTTDLVRRFAQLVGRV
jgi:branched-subunit amino acid aminotransferase/4-amino-4-deoxychorismate lyase